MRIVVVPVVFVVSAIAAAVIGYVIAKNLIAEPLPVMDDVWIWFAFAGIGLAIGKMFKRNLAEPPAAVAATLLVVSSAGNQINIFYHQYPELGDLLGVTPAQEIDGPPPISPSSAGSTSPDL